MVVVGWWALEMPTDEAVHINVQVWRCMVLVEESVDMILGMILDSDEP